MKVAALLSESYHTKDGREIDLKREEDTEPDNRGFTVDKISSYVDGEEVGYLKIQNLPHERFHFFYPTIFNWMQQINGGAGLPYEKSDWHYENLNPKERRSFLKTILHRERLVKYGGEELADKMDDAAILKSIREVEERMERRHGQKFKEFKNYHKDKPFVDYIRVHEDFQRQRIAEAMYLDAAKWMKERGLKFYASSLQSPEAKGAWKHLAKKFDVRKSKSGKRRYLEPTA